MFSIHYEQQDCSPDANRSGGPRCAVYGRGAAERFMRMQQTPAGIRGLMDDKTGEGYYTGEVVKCK